jgi:hypothetical protein
MVQSAITRDAHCIVDSGDLANWNHGQVLGLLDASSLCSVFRFGEPLNPKLHEKHQ